MLYDRAATTVVRFVNDDHETTPLIEMDLATFASEELFALGAESISEARLIGDVAWVVAHDRGGGFLATFDARTPRYLTVRLQNLRDGRGPFVGDGHVYVIESDLDDHRRIVQVDDTPPRVVTNLDERWVLDAAWLEDALWVVSTGEHPRLTRVEPSGTRDDYAIEDEAVAVESAGSRLYVLAGEYPHRLLAQPSQ